MRVLPTASLVAEEVLLELVAQEDHAPAAVQVDVVDVAPARGGDDVAHGREDGAVGRDLGGEAHALAAERARVALELSRELGLGDLAAQRLDVFLAHADAPALAEPVPGQGGARGEGDHDVLAEAVLALHDVLLEAFAEGHQQRHRHRAPGDAEQGEGRAQLLVADVLQHLPEEGRGSSRSGRPLLDLLGRPLHHQVLLSSGPRPPRRSGRRTGRS